jgi:hypothetical protein
MRYKRLISIQELISNTIQSTPYHYKLENGLLLRTCKKVLHCVKKEIISCKMKKDIIYLQLTSTLLCYELQLNKQEIMRKLKEHLSRLNFSVKQPTDIIFVF